MNDMNKLKEQYGEKYKGFGSYTECMSRALLTGLATFALTFSGTYFAQHLLQVKLPQKPTTRLIAPAILGCVTAWVVTARRTKACQMAWMSTENKHSYLMELDTANSRTTVPPSSP